MSDESAPPTVSTIGIDLGKNSFHLVGLDQRGAIVWQPIGGSFSPRPRATERAISWRASFRKSRDP